MGHGSERINDEAVDSTLDLDVFRPGDAAQQAVAVRGRIAFEEYGFSRLEPRDQSSQLSMRTRPGVHF